MLHELWHILWHILFYVVGAFFISWGMALHTLRWTNEDYGSIWIWVGAVLLIALGLGVAIAL